MYIQIHIPCPGIAKLQPVWHGFYGSALLQKKQQTERHCSEESSVPGAYVPHCSTGVSKKSKDLWFVQAILVVNFRGVSDRLFPIGHIPLPCGVASSSHMAGSSPGTHLLLPQIPSAHAMRMHAIGQNLRLATEASLKCWITRSMRNWYPTTVAR